jgi:hypothetical protein
MDLLKAARMDIDNKIGTSTITYSGASYVDWNTGTPFDMSFTKQESSVSTYLAVTLYTQYRLEATSAIGGVYFAVKIGATDYAFFPSPTHTNTINVPLGFVGQTAIPSQTAGAKTLRLRIRTAGASVIAQTNTNDFACMRVSESYFPDFLLA